jgi:hypothetical protein
MIRYPTTERAHQAFMEGELSYLEYRLEYADPEEAQRQAWKRREALRVIESRRAA